MSAESSNREKSSSMGKVFLRNLSFHANEKVLREFFQKGGFPVTSAKAFTTISKQTNQRKPMYYGYVELAEPFRVNEAIRVLNNREFMGRIVQVEPFSDSCLDIGSRGNVGASAGVEGDSSDGSTGQPRGSSRTYQLHVSFKARVAEKRCITEKSLRQLFEQFGHIEDVIIKKHVYDGERKLGGYAFIQYSVDSAADAAISALHNTVQELIHYNCRKSKKFEYFDGEASWQGTSVPVSNQQTPYSPYYPHQYSHQVPQASPQHYLHGYQNTLLGNESGFGMFPHNQHLTPANSGSHDSYDKARQQQQFHAAHPLYAQARELIWSPPHAANTMQSVSCYAPPSPQASQGFWSTAGPLPPTQQEPAQPQQESAQDGTDTDSTAQSPSVASLQENADMQAIPLPLPPALLMGHHNMPIPPPFPFFPPHQTPGYWNPQLQSWQQLESQHNFHPMHHHLHHYPQPYQTYPPHQNLHSQHYNYDSRSTETFMHPFPTPAIPATSGTQQSHSMQQQHHHHFDSYKQQRYAQAVAQQQQHQQHLQQQQQQLWQQQQWQQRRPQAQEAGTKPSVRTEPVTGEESKPESFLRQIASREHSAASHQSNHSH